MVNDVVANANVALMCQDCYERLHYDKEGQLLEEAKNIRTYTYQEG